MPNPSYKLAIADVSEQSVIEMKKYQYDHKTVTLPHQLPFSYKSPLIKELVIKYRGGGGEEIGWVINFQADEKGGHLNIGPVYGVGQVEIEHSSKTSLFQETKGENLPRESDFRSLVVLCFQSF